MQKPKGKQVRPRTLEELLAEGKVLKARADKTYAELLALASEIREKQAKLEDARAKERDPMQ